MTLALLQLEHAAAVRGRDEVSVLVYRETEHCHVRHPVRQLPPVDAAASRLKDADIGTHVNRGARRVDRDRVDRYVGQVARNTSPRRGGQTVGGFEHVTWCGRRGAIESRERRVDG